MEASNNTESFSRFFSRSGRFPLGDSPPPPPFPHLLYFRLFPSRIRLVTLFLVLLGRFTTLLVSVPEMGPYARDDLLRDPVALTELKLKEVRVCCFKKEIRKGDAEEPRLKWPFSERLFSPEIRVISRSFPTSLVPGSRVARKKIDLDPRNICKLDG